jgi:GNAT superfamily N-acetyltransferase
MTERSGREPPRIRPATRADIATVLEHRLAMLEAVFQSEHPDMAQASPQQMREANAAWLERHLGEDFHAWLAELDGRAVGSAAVMWFPHPPSPINPIGLEAYVLNVFTDARWRRRGVARALMERIVEEARARGVKRIWLRASEDGRPLYVDMGCRESNYLQLLDE